MNWDYTVRAHADLDAQTITLETQRRTHLMTHTISLQDAKLKDALQKLGWVSPGGHAVELAGMKTALDAARGETDEARAERDNLEVHSNRLEADLRRRAEEAFSREVRLQAEIDALRKKLADAGAALLYSREAPKKQKPGCKLREYSLVKTPSLSTIAELRRAAMGETADRLDAIEKALGL